MKSGGRVWYADSATLLPLSDGLLAIVHEIAPSIEGIYALGYKEPEDSSGFSSPSKFKEIRILLF